MNERIRELTVKALSSCNPAKMTSLSSSVDNGDGVDIPLEFSEKFAELIVRESIDGMKNAYSPDDCLPQEEITEFLKEHFGVTS